MNYFITIIFSIIINLTAFLSVPFSELEKAFSTGDATEIVKYGKSKILINIDQKEGVYSQSQGSQILKSFFKDHPPKSFDFHFKGKESGASSYAVGTYLSEHSFRVTLKFQLEKEVYKIESISIEKE